MGPAVMPTLPSSAQAAFSAAFSSAAPARVLLVEDDADLREALTENLRLNGISVLDVETGAAFREAVRVSQVDAAIIDVNLPDASGFDLAKELYGREDRPGIVILTARNGRQDRLLGYAGGADLYMTKPVDNEELVLAVRNLAQRVAGARRERDDGAQPAAAWQLDLARKLLVAPDGTILVLSGREAMLLELLEKAKGNPLSRSYLGSVMGYGAPGPEHRGLDAAVRRLRRKAALRQIDLPLLVVQSLGLRFVAPLKITERTTGRG